jgi:hypothetical protein
MLPTVVTKALSRQDAKKTFLLGALCGFARDTVFPTSFSSQNFKYLWLDFGSNLKAKI